MPKRILVILGNPAKKRKSFCEALAQSYMDGAKAAGHDVTLLKLSDLNFDPVLHEGYHGYQETELDLELAQEKMADADHWVFVYPLWQFMIPALLKGFMERTLTKGFAFDFGPQVPVSLLKGKTARLIQTMAMPGLAYKTIFGQHGMKALRSMLHFVGIKPIRVTYCELVENPNDGRRQAYLEKVFKLGRSGI